MEDYMETISTLHLSRERKKERDADATQHELTAFLGLTGKLNFLEHGCRPMAAFVASHLQQKNWELECIGSESRQLHIQQTQAGRP